jgi:hypothetical protein
MSRLEVLYGALAERGTKLESVLFRAGTGPAYLPSLFEFFQDSFDARVHTEHRPVTRIHHDTVADAADQLSSMSRTGFVVL